MDGEDKPYDRAVASSCYIKEALRAFPRRKRPEQPNVQHPPCPSEQRRKQSLSEHPFDLDSDFSELETGRETVLYLAYGSNLSTETFRGKRGIRPLAQVNVQVPTLKLTFDLPGVPYAEPCFANTARRDPENDSPSRAAVASSLTEKTPLLAAPPSGPHTTKEDYHKNRWHKDLVGVVYEVTLPDYAHIIATEGGGSSYQDILVDCFPLPTDPSLPVPPSPTTAPFKAHTLFSPAVPADQPAPPGGGGRFQRPDTSYAQPSARYLKLITDGAAECALPDEYRAYLAQLRAYTPTSQQQRMGAFVFLGFWSPIVMFVFGLQGVFGDKKGRAPAWLVLLTGAIFRAVWASYDGFFKEIFGEGERTVERSGGGDGNAGGGEGGMAARMMVWRKRKSGGAGMEQKEAVHAV
ncbi:hypothetical protein LTR04_007154 [Oleoguttula sp. CCFEE 6159]|nr:hypothetical protein LTR04_007154 [Oleoguttula sp. CCFEE 6159]